MAISNDTRGWIMSAVSGIACVLGSAIICIDVILRRITHRRFQIASSNGFLSASLCLSAGVMLFTSLYSMLPTSKQYLTRAGMSARTSAFTLTGLFLAGVIVIRIVSGLLHQFIPSHVVDCAHTHDPDADIETGDGEMEECHHSLHESTNELGDDSADYTERSPLLRPNEPLTTNSTPAVFQRSGVDALAEAREESLRSRFARRLRRVLRGGKSMCDENGPCYGFSQTCGRECTKTLLLPKTAELTLPDHHGHGHSQGLSQAHDDFRRHHSICFQPASEQSLLSDEAPTPQTVRRVSDGWLPDPTHPFSDHNQRSGFFDHVATRQPLLTPSSPHPPSRGTESVVHKSYDDDESEGSSPSSSSPLHKPQSHGGPPTQQQQHHHHVPQNAFLSIGLQTSLAIALHKLPEGFITYATNHANPTLGMTVFVALFIHNITEGFAMALPLYLALNSRWKAMFWSSLLGGISQPLGAGIATLWLWGARQGGDGDGGDGVTTGPSWGVYGGMFAATAGVMTSVALQLFSEGLSLTHKPNFAMLFAIAGMGLMGLSFALTA